jgi:hypothetical protein
VKTVKKQFHFVQSTNPVSTMPLVLIFQCQILFVNVRPASLDYFANKNKIHVIWFSINTFVDRAFV